MAPAVGSSKTLISANDDLQEVFMHVKGCTEIRTAIVCHRNDTNCM